jgi:hypothetical protein
MREWFWSLGSGRAGAGPVGPAHGQNPFAPKPPHFPAKAKSVIFLFMDGGPSQMDTFDPKPRLAKENGQPIKVKVEPTQFNNIGNVFGSPWKFQQYGQSGIPVSELFPHVATCVDDLAIIRSMVSNFSEHTNANYFMHSGHGQHGSLGELWLGQHLRESSGVYCLEQRYDSARWNGLLRQWFPASNLPGIDVSKG